MRTSCFSVTLAALIATGAWGTSRVLGDAPIGPQFSYQGQITSGGAAANGPHNLVFTLWDAPGAGAPPVGGVQIGVPVNKPNTPVTDGLFTAQLNEASEFGAAAFNGQARWLQISVNGTTLAPRQPLTAAPFAAYALAAPGGASGWSANGADIHNTNVGNVGIGTSSPQSILHVAGGTGALRLDANDHPSSYLLLEDRQPTQAKLNKFNNAGTVLFDINPIPLDGVSEAAVRFFRETNTTGPKFVYFHRGNNTVASSAFIGADGGDSSFQLHGGNVGIGTSTPQTKLEITDANAYLRLTASGNNFGPRLQFKNPSGSSSVSHGTIEFLNGSNTVLAQIGHSDPIIGNTGLVMTTPSGIFKMNDTGNVGIGTYGPLDKLHVVGSILSDGDVRARSTNDPTSEVFLGWGVDGNGDDMARIRIGGNGIGANNGLDIQRVANVSLMRIQNNGNVGIGTSTPQAKLDVNGTARVTILQIVGADVAEKFAVSGDSQEAAPGTVMEIDPENPGKLRVARGAYNHRVAGVVSGAGDLHAGTVLGNMPGYEDSPPIALSGRVWVRCDASTAAIMPGDLLTTSDTPGHAMKAADRDRSAGAAIGKAMTALDVGQGLVLVLVNLN